MLAVLCLCSYMPPILLANDCKDTQFDGVVVVSHSVDNLPTSVQSAQSTLDNYFKVYFLACLFLFFVSFWFSELKVIISKLKCVQKKVNQCIMYTFSLLCQILTKFFTNNVTSNCKQITKFQWNLPTSAKVIASLARSLVNMKCPLLAAFKRDCQVQNWNKFTICVQNILQVLKCKLDDVNVTAWLFHRWSIGHHVEMFSLFDQNATSAGDTVNLAAVHTCCCSFRQIR